MTGDDLGPGDSFGPGDDLGMGGGFGPGGGLGTGGVAGPPIGGEGWARLLSAARRSLERTGGALTGSVSLSAPSDAERRVVIGVTGVHRSSSSGRLTVRLADLDGYLRDVTGGVGLAEVVAADEPLRDRPAEARARAAAVADLLSLAGTGRHAGADWYTDWLDGLRRDGTLTRAVRTGLPFAHVIRVLDALPAADEPMPVFAERVLRDTKALTEGPLRGILLRALAAWQGLPVPSNTELERALWEAVGVVPDDLSSQVLVLNVPAEGGLVGSWLTEAARYGVPMRITLHHLRLSTLVLRCSEIFVCENPAVLRAATATLGADCRPLVCAEGVPSAALHALLRCAPDAVVRWRNDFDWAGVRITGAALRRYPNARPWRMTCSLYRAAMASDFGRKSSDNAVSDISTNRPDSDIPPQNSDAAPVLLGTPAPTPWDPELSPTMRERGRAVMEERLLMPLLADLSTGPTT